MKDIKDLITERNWYVNFTRYFLYEILRAITGDVIRRFDVSQHAMITK